MWQRYLLVEESDERVVCIYFALVSMIEVILLVWLVTGPIYLTFTCMIRQTGVSRKEYCTFNIYKNTVEPL